MLMLGRKPVSPLCMPYAGFEKATNCILEIPQNIKLTLENNVLTLKAGSILTKTGSTYATVTTTSDTTTTFSNNGRYFIYATAEGTLYNWFKVDRFGSGSSLPADNADYDDFFNTTDKRVYLYGTDGWYIWRELTQCYPLGVVVVSSGVASFAKDSNGNDMIFNGAGFIGHHAFVYPGVKFLCPNGFDLNGNYLNIERTSNSLSIIEMNAGNNIMLYGSNFQLRNYFDDINNVPDNVYIAVAYNKSENINYYRSTPTNEWVSTKGYYCNMINFQLSNNIVSNFTIQQPLTKYKWVVKLIP